MSAFNLVDSPDYGASLKSLGKSINALTRKQLAGAEEYLKDWGIEEGLTKEIKDEEGNVVVKSNFGHSNEKKYSHNYKLKAHPLGGEREGQYAVSLNDNLRLVYRWFNEGTIEIVELSTDTVELVEVVDYHERNKKKSSVLEEEDESIFVFSGSLRF